MMVERYSDPAWTIRATALPDIGQTPAICSEHYGPAGDLVPATRLVI